MNLLQACNRPHLLAGSSSR